MKNKVPCLCLRNSWNPEMGYLNKQLYILLDFFPATYSAQAHYGLCHSYR
jgi:hypothetical protein